MVPGCLKTSCGLPTFCLAVIAFLAVTATAGQKPHILHVEVADAGWSDVGWNSPEFKTPYLDRLRGQGVALPHFYSQPTGTASRIALLTGRYPYTIGYKSIKGMYFPYSNFSLPLEYKLLPKYLQDRGYSTHLSGTWDMGFCSEDYLPQRRGFETFYGSLKGFLDHYNHTSVGLSAGYDFWNGSTVDRSAQGKYSTTLFSDRAVDIVSNHSVRDDQRPLYIFLAFDALRKPLQAPAHFIKKCNDIEDSDRKIRCAMMAAVDDGVKRVIRAFKDAEYLGDLLVIFHSSSGGPLNVGSRNYPLRAKKASVYEGGTRVPAFLYSKTLFGEAANSSFVGPTHITDLFPTVLKAAKMGTSRLPDGLDGVNQWTRLTSGRQSARRDMVYDVDISTGDGAVRRDGYKLVKFSEFATQKCPGYIDFPPSENKPRRVDCKEYELYNLDTDPAEEHDLSDVKRNKLAKLKDRYEAAEARAVPHVVFVNATASYPENNDGVWQPYGC
ncbi:arylsulfatase I-like [Littorina saxatilis]|uniref:Sulfatase N-terminal domain-containing protein n=1 Tax=Littorina saxatilis TaxID=31220 RepID=A0AAN9BLW2_9CAEN